MNKIHNNISVRHYPFRCLTPIYKASTVPNAKLLILKDVNNCLQYHMECKYYTISGKYTDNKKLGYYTIWCSDTPFGVHCGTGIATHACVSFIRLRN